ncbi:hypothetical protein CEXT_292081 [Caerostris extrusa]|uniref:Uncharacterized protein n=1 Tax=Caerostris extrusa TaxID=172846 RepID=A0AAV4SQT4_CAEEX|nr:hypothetical protein CEXT_292081 [Caerostris extrusa]
MRESISAPPKRKHPNATGKSLPEVDLLSDEYFVPVLYEHTLPPYPYVLASRDAGEKTFERNRKSLPEVDLLSDEYFVPVLLRTPPLPTTLLEMRRGFAKTASIPFGTRRESNDCHLNLNWRRIVMNGGSSENKSNHRTSREDSSNQISENVNSLWLISLFNELCPLFINAWGLHE